MDKKNTMLLTVIAVATLLVAVVGATFAYFSVQAGAEGSTTAVTGTVASAGVVTGTVGEDQVYITLSNTDMRKDSAAKYYAVAEGNYTTTANSHNVFSATLANAAAGETYTCTFDMGVTVTGNDNFAAGDAVLTINGVGDADFDKSHVLVSTFDGIATKEVEWTFTANGTKTITMNAYIENKADTVQNETLANTNLGVSVNVTNFKCDVSK